tara:strand:+ start:771 stop:1013 length:243 start_codon:yes stop_codon:yes gene_type:complete
MVTIRHILDNRQTLRVMCLGCRAFADIGAAQLEALPNRMTTERICARRTCPDCQHVGCEVTVVVDTPNLTTTHSHSDPPS